MQNPNQDSLLDAGLEADIAAAPTDHKAARGSVKGRGRKDRAKPAGIDIRGEFVPNATHPEKPKMAMTLLEEATEAAIEARLSGEKPFKLLAEGIHGAGKTTFFETLVTSLGESILERTGMALDVIRVPTQTATPEDQVLVGVKVDDEGRKYIDYTLYRRWVDPTTWKIFVFDEISRASQEVRNQLLEVLQEQRLGDREIPNVLLMVGLANAGRAYAVQKLDYALASRFDMTIDVGLNETPWRIALAARFPEIDLNEFFAEYDRLKDLDDKVQDGAATVRDIIVPRTLEHLIWNLTKGNPGMWAIPSLDGMEYVKVLDREGNDQIPVAVQRLADALGMRNPSTVPDKYRRMLDQAYEDGVNVLGIGLPGGGKTSGFRAWAETHHPQTQTTVLNGASTNPDSMFLPLFNDNEVDIALMDQFTRPGEKMLVLDDIWRADGVTRSKFMEIQQERSIGGIAIEGLRMVVAFTNPREMGGIRQDVGKPDLAQADRFFATVFLTEEDMPAAEYLLATYGEEAAPILDWRAEDLDDKQRELVNFRIVEALIRLDQMGLPLETALPKMGGSRIPVPLHDLRRRLDARPVARIRAIAENVERYEKHITDGSLSHAYEVVGAFRRAQPSQLVEHVDAVMRLLPLLAGGSLERTLVSLLRQGGKRTMFWFFCLEKNKDAAVKAFN